MYNIYVHTHMHIFLNGIMLLGVVILPPKNHRLMKPQCQAWQTSFELLVREYQETLVADLVLEGKTLLLKMPQTLDIGVRGVKLESRWKPPA